MRIEIGTSAVSLGAVGVDTHGAEQGAPHTDVIAEQPSAAIATGAATSDSSTIKTITARVCIS